MDLYETVSFRLGPGRAYKLVTHQDSRGKQHLSLFKNDVPDDGLMGSTLNLLRLLARQATKPVTNTEILKTLYPTSTTAVIDTHVSHLRTHFEESKDQPQLIEVIHGHAHRLMVPATRTGDLGGITTFQEWRDDVFIDFLRNIKRDQGEGSDLRILTTHFSGSVTDLKLGALLDRGVRIKILMMNPANEAMTLGRHSLRQDKKPVIALRELPEQIEAIGDLVASHRAETAETGQGTLELRLTDLLPCGFLAQSNDRALLGILPIHCSYTFGPMLDIRGDTPLWQLLKKDFDVRWTAKLRTTDNRAHQGH